MKGTGAKRNVFPGSCVSTGAKFPVAPVESAPMLGRCAVGQTHGRMALLKMSPRAGVIITVVHMCRVAR